MTTSKKKPAGFITAWQLSKDSFHEFKSGWKRYALIVACVAIPADILGMSGTAGPFSTIGAFMLLASLMMNVAVTWAIVQKERTGVIPRPSEAYYDGSVALVRFVLVIFALLVLALPATVGLVFYAMAQNAFLATGASLGEELLISFVCLLLGLISAWWFTRFGLALTAVVASNLRPIAALRYARRLTIGHFWTIVRRYLGLFLTLIALAVPIALVTALLAVLRLSPLALLFAQLCTNFIALPLTNIYLLRLYRALEPKPRAEHSQYEPHPETAA